MDKQSLGEKKLSQLLREYMEEKKKNPEGFLEISTVLMTGCKAMDVYMISKEFGFIERLVDSDKIDHNKFENLIDRYYDLEDYYLTEQVLMFLSIQDEPIKFLSEILEDE